MKENNIDANLKNKKSLKDLFMSSKQYLHKIFYEDETNSYDFTLPDTTNAIVADKSTNYSADNGTLNLDNETLQSADTSNDKVFQSLDVNLEYMKTRFNTLINSDIKIREFTLNARNKQYNAFLLYIDGMISQDIMNNYILKPLMLKNSANSYEGNQNRIVAEAKTNNITVRKVKKFNIIEYISNCLLPQNTVENRTKFDDIVADINSGSCALFIDTLDICFSIEVKGFERRGLTSPNNEIIVRGPQVGFTENLRTNTSLLRRYINNENLIIESVNVGKLSKTSCAICYLKNVANTDLVSEVRYRLNNLGVDYLISSGQLEQLIQDSDLCSLPQMVSTERPDRTANLLYQGRVCIIVNGSPYVLIAPGILSDFLESPEDLNLKHQYSNFARVLRIVSAVIALLLPGVYIAITNFHQELIPTELLYAIISSREFVPFPILFEVLVMEFSFELIREASLRVPSPIGPTIGIVGALILGQAAVEANIVSPILIIIVALTGICSFAVPDFSLSFHFRIMRSFGVYYLETDFLKNTNIENGIILHPAFDRENRSSFLKTKRPKIQNEISMKWKYNKN